LHLDDPSGDSLLNDHPFGTFDAGNGRRPPHQSRHQPGADCIVRFSAPVFDHSGSIALAITAIGPSHIFDANWDGPIAEELLKCAANVSMRLGFSSKGSKGA
jgi:hypothetical protein